MTEQEVANDVNSIVAYTYYRINPQVLHPTNPEIWKYPVAKNSLNICGQDVV